MDCTDLQSFYILWWEQKFSLFLSGNAVALFCEVSHMAVSFSVPSAVWRMSESVAVRMSSVSFQEEAGYFFFLEMQNLEQLSGL
jgi:hypothetical protein